MLFAQRPVVRWMAGFVLVCALVAALFSITLVFAKNISQPHSWHVQVGAESPDHAIQGMTFLPQQIWIDAGDTVVWTVKSGEPHTVTFLTPGQRRPPFNPNNPLQTSRQGSRSYDGHSYYNSGLLSSISLPGFSTPQTYALTFAKAGNYSYICLVHTMMNGTIHVQAAGTPYPYTQQDYDSQIAAQTATLLRDGSALGAKTLMKATSHSVIVGTGDHVVDVMRFFPQRIVIHVGDTVAFTNLSVMEPHTVSYGHFTVPDNQATGNPKAFDGTSPLNSGFLFIGQPAYRVTFVKAGTYHFYCALHDVLGMLLDVVVQP